MRLEEMATRRLWNGLVFYDQLITLLEIITFESAARKLHFSLASKRTITYGIRFEHQFVQTCLGCISTSHCQQPACVCLCAFCRSRAPPLITMTMLLQTSFEGQPSPQRTWILPIRATVRKLMSDRLTETRPWIKMKNGEKHLQQSLSVLPTINYTVWVNRSKQSIACLFCIHRKYFISFNQRISDIAASSPSDSVTNKPWVEGGEGRMMKKGQEKMKVQDPCAHMLPNSFRCHWVAISERWWQQSWGLRQRRIRFFFHPVLPFPWIMQWLLQSLQRRWEVAVVHPVVQGIIFAPFNWICNSKRWYSVSLLFPKFFSLSISVTNAWTATVCISAAK